MKKLIIALLKSATGKLILGILLENFKSHLLEKINNAKLDIHTTQNIEAFVETIDLEDFINNVNLK